MDAGEHDGLLDPAPAATPFPRAPDLDPAPWELQDLAALRGGDEDFDVVERNLVVASRAQGCLYVALAEGLDALRHGDRLAVLGSHLDDYAREALDLGKRVTDNLARLGRDLRTRPLLREALRSGRVRVRAAQTVAALAIGDFEATWVERAATLTVRELEVEVRRARSGGDDDGDEPLLSLEAPLYDEERTLMDHADALARRILPHATRAQRLEAMAQEFLSACPDDPDADDARRLSASFRAAPVLGEEDRKAILEGETERWSMLPTAPALRFPEFRFELTASAEDIDRTLREVARLWRGWDGMVGHYANAIRRSGAHRLLGYASFRHFCEERLGLPARTVETRAKLEDQIWRSRALQEGRRQRLGYEKLRALTKLPETDVLAWLPRAHALTAVALRRSVAEERERQMRVRRKIVVPLPRRIAVVLAAAIEAARARAGHVLVTGAALAAIAAHFVTVWQLVKGSKTRSQRVRERDGGHCQVPGCSRPGTHAHHVEYRSRGGSDDAESQIALCPFHHLFCIHRGYLAVTGVAPDRLEWWLGRERWYGPAGPPPALPRLDA